MKRSQLKRVTRPIKRRKRLAPTNKARRAKLHAKNFSGPFKTPHDAWVRGNFCAVNAWCKEHTMQAAHAKSRGAGGTWRDLVPLCHDHHEEQHRIGTKAFEKKWGVDLTAEAARQVAAHQAEEGREP